MSFSRTKNTSTTVIHQQLLIQHTKMNPKFVNNMFGGQAKEEVRALLHQLAEPMTCSLVRAALPGDMTSQGSALAKPIQTFTVDWTQPPTVPGTSILQLQSQMGTGSPLPISLDLPYTPILTDVRTEPFVLLRDPVVSFIRRNLVPSTAQSVQSTYTLVTQFPGASRRVPATSAFERYSFMSGPGIIVPIPFSHMVFSAGDWKIYGDYAPCGVVGDRRVFWADGSDVLDTAGTRNSPTPTNFAQGWVATLRMKAGSTIGPNKYAIQIVQHLSETESTIVHQQQGVVTIDVVETVVPLTPVAIPFSGYFSVALIFDDGADSDNPITVTQGSLLTNIVSGYQHVSLSAEQQMMGLLDKVRVNGASILVSNVVSEITKGGTVYQCQPPGDRPWYYWFDAEAISDLNTDLRSILPWSKGAYAFVKPQGNAPLQLRTAYSRPGLLVEANATAHSVPQFKPFEQYGTVVVLCVPSTIPTDAPQYPTSQATVTVCRAIEFTTRGQFFNIDTSRIPTHVYDEFVDAARLLPQFYENPLHIAMIGALIARVATQVMIWAPRVVAGITAFKAVQRTQQEARVAKPRPQNAAPQREEVVINRPKGGLQLYLDAGNQKRENFVTRAGRGKNVEHVKASVPRRSSSKKRKDNRRPQNRTSV
jgi:hypothetical protein